MPARTRVFAKVFLALNIVAALVFAYLAFVQTMFTDFDVRARYTALDRVGAINEAALEQFHASYGFAPGSYRNTVPRYIAGPALYTQKANALWALGVATSNVILGIVLLAARRGRTPAAPMPQEPS